MELSSLLHPVDYAIFTAVLVISLGIGIFTSMKSRKQNTTSEYFLGSRQMTLLPVTLSMMVSFISSNTFMGYPAESYAFGIQLWMSIIGSVIGMVSACYLFVGLFYSLHLTSITEYLEMRYESRVIRYVGSISNIVCSLWYAGSVYYGPSTAIESVMGFPAWAAIVVSGSVCIVYTVVGGFKAVVWTDSFQTLVMIVGIITVFIKGLLLAGGVSEVASISREWGRLNFFILDADPRIRLNLWGVVIGDAIGTASNFGFNQVAVQRYSSLSSLYKARMAIMLSIPGIVLLLTAAAFTGLAIFAYYSKQGCDPIADGKISNPNQIIFYFIAETLQAPSLPGLFLASTMAASLSTVSSLLNSNAAMQWKDFVSPCFPRLSDKTAGTATKILVLLNGIVAMSAALIFANIGGTILQMATVIISATAAPLCALYFMGVFIPWINWKGALIGSIASFILGSWVAIGSFTIGKNWEPLPTATWACYTGNSTVTTATAAFITSTVADLQVESLSWVERNLYSLSFLWLLPIFMALCVIISILASAATGLRSPSTVDKRLVHPILHKCVKLKDDQKKDISTKDLILQESLLTDQLTKV